MKGFWIGALFGVAICFLGFQAFNRWIRLQPAPQAIVVTKTDTLTVRDTVFVSISKKVYVEKAPAVILPDAPDEAYLDTLISVTTNKEVRVDTRLSLAFNTKGKFFHDVALEFPLIEYPLVTMQVTKTERVPYLLPAKSKTWKYVEAGVIGACIGATAYGLISAGR